MSIETDAADADRSESVDELASALGTAIADMPVYERFAEAKAAVEADEEAQEAIVEFEQLRDEFVTARQTGEATQEDLMELQNAQHDLHEIPVMSDYLAAQSELELRLQELNETISEEIAIDFGEKAGGCCAD
jgi:cell fate (sporulation/competence/biofilm development) regulator YlbF (YheA/YmcA/DUF963 family)